MYEKCSTCGTQAERLPEISAIMGDTYFRCPHCPGMFKEGFKWDGENFVESPPSHGICENCVHLEEKKQSALDEAREMREEMRKRAD